MPALRSLPPSCLLALLLFLFRSAAGAAFVQTAVATLRSASYFTAPLAPRVDGSTCAALTVRSLAALAAILPPAHRSCGAAWRLLGPWTRERSIIGASSTARRRRPSAFARGIRGDGGLKAREQPARMSQLRRSGIRSGIDESIFTDRAAQHLQRGRTPSQVGDGSVSARSSCCWVARTPWRRTLLMSPDGVDEQALPGIKLHGHQVRPISPGVPRAGVGSSVDRRLLSALEDCASRRRGWPVFVASVPRGDYAPGLGPETKINVDGRTTASCASNVLPRKKPAGSPPPMRPCRNGATFRSTGRPTGWTAHPGIFRRRRAGVSADPTFRLTGGRTRSPAATAAPFSAVLRAPGGHPLGVLVLAHARPRHGSAGVREAAIPGDRWRAG